MSDGKALHAAICADPADDSARLVYADWLEDNGDPDRAEFIRGQIELLRLTPDDSRFDSLSARTAELEKKNLTRWKRELPRWAKLRYAFVVAELMRRPDYLPESDFHRGFPTVVDCTAEEWCSGAEKLLGRAPVEGVSFREVMNEGAFLLEDAPHLDRLTAIDIGGEITTELVAFLAALPTLSNLRVLKLNHDELLEPRAIAAVAKSKSLAGLEYLDLSGNHFGAAGVRELARSTTLRNLQTLVLSHNELGDAGLRALANSPVLASVRSLNVGGNDLTAAGVSALAKSSHLGALTHLHLGFNGFRTPGAVALADSAPLDHLVALDLQRNPIGPAGIAALTRARLGPLQTLVLDNCDLDANAAESLAGCPALASLRQLDVATNPIGSAGVSALARSPYLGNLRELWLGYTEAGDDGVLALARYSGFRRLRDLALYGVGISDVGARALAESDQLTGLRWLSLGYNRIGREGGLALANAPWIDGLETLQLGGNPLGAEAKRALRARLGKRLQL